MTINDYLKSIPAAAAHELGAAVDIWSNDACNGYAVAACQALGYSKSQVRELLSAMGAAFDRMGVDDAAALYRDTDC